MDDKTLQRKLDQLVCLANEIGKEAVSRYGPHASLFHESSDAIQTAVMAMRLVISLQQHTQED